MTTDIVETANLPALEAIIERGLTTFVEVGQALLAIRDGRLYRDGYSDFDTYCRERWGWSRQRAHQFIAASEAVAQLSTIVDTGPLPANEAQARELAPLRHDPETMREAWQESQSRGDGHPTAAAIRGVVREFSGQLVDVETDRIIPPSRLAPLMTSDSPEWYSPRHIVERAILALGAIDLDPCSNSGPLPNVPATKHYTATDDGLVQPWAGRVYLNPPYGRDIDNWVERLVDDHRAGRVTAAIALVPSRTDTAWFRLFRDYPRCFVDGRLKFSGHENAAPFPSVVVYLGMDVGAFIGAFGDVGDIYTRVNT